LNSAILRYALVGVLLLSGAGLVWADQDPFMILAGPKNVERFDLTDEQGNKVWVLEAKPATNPEILLYGVVPGGFSQVDPADDVPPRRLVPGEVLTMKTTTEILIFTHTGVASGSTNMEIINYSMKRVESPD
jgi:hypothetical protein